jgi:hypothetical protein
LCILPEVESLLQTRFALPHQIVEPIMSLVDCLPCSVRQIRLGHTRPLREEWVAPCRQRALPAPSAVLHRSRRASQKVAAPGGLQALQALRPARAARPARLPSTARSLVRIEPLDCQFWNRSKERGSPLASACTYKGSTRRDPGPRRSIVSNNDIGRNIAGWTRRESSYRRC